MAGNTYQELKKIRDEWRKELEAQAPQPHSLQGASIVPAGMVIEGPEKQELYFFAVHAATQVAMATIVTCAEEMGWEKYINRLDAMQRPSVRKTGLELVKKYGILGNNCTSVINLDTSWAIGCGFWEFRMSSFSEDNVEGYGSQCPQIDALKEMGIEDKEQELWAWCDLYDNMIGGTVNENTAYVHTECIGRGDKRCRFFINYHKKEDDVYQTITRLKKAKCAATEGTDPAGEGSRGLGLPDWLSSWTLMDVLRDGIKTKSRIFHDNMLFAAGELGWEKFINLASEKQTTGHRREAEKLKEHYNIDGTDFYRAVFLASIGYAMCGCDKHQVIELTDGRLEAVSGSCPVVDSARHIGVDRVDDLSLWCDYYHNIRLQAVNPDYRLVHTHCLGRGDKFCRIVMK